jgi:hypothetical protein
MAQPEYKAPKALLAHKDQLALQVRMELMAQLEHKARKDQLGWPVQMVQTAQRAHKARKEQRVP